VDAEPNSDRSKDDHDDEEANPPLPTRRRSVFFRFDNLAQAGPGTHKEKAKEERK